MEVPDTVLENFKCEKCGNYLSRAPILMLDNNRSRCGRCLEPEQDVKRYNMPYEELAQLMKFPCRYEENGCEEKIRFEENKAHEEVCVYKRYSCPIDQCDWSEKPGILLEGHFKSDHRTNVIRNSCDIKPGENYMLLEFDSIFLVLTKMCTETNKIYCCVRLIAESELASKYTFVIDVANGNNQLKICGQVAPEGCLMLQDDISVVLDINGLVTMLGEFKDTIVRLTVRSTDDEVKRKQVRCNDCKSMTDLVYNSINWKHWKCRICAPDRRPCRRHEKGCKYADYNEKCHMHELYFCPYSTYCRLCKKTITGICLGEHYEQDHAAITYRLGEVCSESVLRSVKSFIITCNFGYAICHYFHHSLFLNAPVPSAHVYMYTWEVETDKHSYMLAGNYDHWNDWSVTLDEQPEWYNNKGTLRITCKKENP